MLFDVYAFMRDRFAQFSARAAGWIIVITYLILVGIATAIVYVLAPGPEDHAEIVTGWEGVALLGFVLWIGYSIYMVFGGSDRYDRLYKEHLAERQLLKEAKASASTRGIGDQIPLPSNNYRNSIILFAVLIAAVGVYAVGRYYLWW